MKLEIDSTSDPTSITWKFTAGLDEIAKCEFSNETLNFISKLERSPGIADQLEVLLEYFHAIEGTHRTTELANYLHYLNAVNTSPAFNSGMFATSAYILPSTRMP